MKIYLAGQMGGIKHFNAHAFDNAARRLRGVGHDVINPIDLDRADGHEVMGQDGMNTDPIMRRHFLGRDLKLISECDALYMIRGWYKSGGARLEHAFALETELKIIYEEDGEL